MPPASNMRRLGLCLLAVLMTLAVVDLQSLDDEFNNSNCVTAKTCGECLRAGPKCGWCGAALYPRGEPRCNIISNLKRNCSDEDITNPSSTSEIKKLTKEDDWTSGDKVTPPVQVKPQEMEFHVRPNDAQVFKLKFQQQANYPVDLYFLLDITYGMKRTDAAKNLNSARDMLISLGQEIPRSMENITNNFRLGFGTFVDKTVMPYSAWTPELFKARCPDETCRDPHLYQHQVKLGNDPDEFKDKMTDALSDISMSMDDTEGGMEGLVQALDCDVVGWRDVSRRIIVYSSNSQFHLAGSGKFGGATKQSDLKCSLDSSNLLTDNVNDYPSVSQISSKMQEKKANVIFAVTKGVSMHYKKLNSYLDGAEVGELEDDSSNIVQLISDKYYALRSKIKFQPSNSDIAEFTFRSNCGSGPVEQTNECKELAIGDDVEFEVTMKVKPDVCKGQAGTVEKSVSVDAVGLNEKLKITLKIMCECECELPLPAPQTEEEVKSQQEDKETCNGGNNTLKCGICDCELGRYGRHCECDETQISNIEALKKCKATNTSDVCSGNGECICGECTCLPVPGRDAAKGEIYQGEFCQCDNYNCLRASNGLVCGGSGQGSCNCGECECADGWKGEDCGCSTTLETCKAKNNETCNNAGTCECGRCTCDPTKNMRGPTCEDCLGCSRCDEYIDCAQCTGFGSGRLSNKPDCDKKCNSNIQRTFKRDTLPSGQGIRQCKGTDVDKCDFFFTYKYTDTNDVRVVVQQTKKCPEEAPVGAIVGGTVAAVVLIPLLIIFLFIFIRNRRDAKEFADFMKERDKARWDSGANPIYKDPKSTFQNPTYRGGKQ